MAKEKGLLTFLFVVVAATSSVLVLSSWLSHSGAVPLRRTVREVPSPLEENLEENRENSSVRIKRKGGIIRLKFPTLHQRRAEMGIPVGQAREPPLCPPPPVTQSLAICDLEKCSSYLDCPRNMACCFNGCIHSCIEPMDGPAAFDWVEDTSKVLPILGVDFEESAKPFIPILHNSTTKYAAAEAGEELIHLTGGCLVTVTRYTKLKEFMKAPSIKDCRCDDGEVVCDITTSRS